MFDNDDSEYRWHDPQYEVERKHPYGDFLPTGLKILVIGSFPSKATRYFDFFYGSKLNRFWPLISEAFKHDFKSKMGPLAVEERQIFMDKHKIGFTDMLAKCYRYRDRSGDESLFPIVLKDILRLLDEHKSIKRLVFTGRQYIIGPLGLFITYLCQQDMEIESLRKDELKNVVGLMNYNGRLIDIMVPYSPSARLAERPDYDFQHMIKMYRKCLSI